ncbi:MAG: UDP-3-O-(3-hydroxymyristoyl)glucosamine N-acyltransferase [Synergistes sp.]|nr:UDP-3-O-(3-hydroxymyristoyl)glucosamine N-acyltransferase [Synergistes sp.]
MTVKKISLAQAAEIVKGSVKGDPEIQVCEVLPPEKAREGSISPLWEKKFIPSVRKGTVLLTKRGWIGEGENGIETDDPRVALIALLAFLSSEPKAQPGISADAYVSSDAVIGNNVSVAAGAVIKAGAVIGENTVVMENAVICEDAEIGPDCFIEPGVVVYRRSKIGRGCVLHSNCVIGCEGFGFIPDPKAGMVKIPQIGIARLDDGVEIGACSSVDRATFGETYIGPMTKIDSHVKIGHNCEIGAYTIIVAQSGIAGSTKIGRGVIMAAQSGASNHSTIGDGCTVGGRGGVVCDIPPGSTVSGFPAQNHKLELRQQAAIRRLPEMVRQLHELEKRIDRIENTCDADA